jgi:hypothetical protein
VVSNIEQRSDPESDRLRIERRGAAARRVNQLATGSFLCADRSGTGDWSRNCLVTDDGGWHVTLAQTQSTGEPIQRFDGTMVDRIFCGFRDTRSVIISRACLTSPDSESAPAALPPAARGYRSGNLANTISLAGGSDVYPSLVERIPEHGN